MLLGVGVVGLVVGIVGYAGGSWAVVLDQLVRDGVFLLLWLVAAAGWGAGGLGLVLPGKFRSAISDLKGKRPSPLPSPGVPGEGGKSSPVLTGVTAIALGLGVMSLAVLGLGLSGTLNRTTAFLLLVLGILLGALVAYERISRGGVEDALRRWLRAPAGWEWLLLLSLPLLSVALVGAILPPGMLWQDEPHGYDVVEYHFQVPREWYEAGKITPLRHNVFSYFPFNVEMHYLLAMHLRGGPWDGMYLAQLMHVAYVALSVVAVYGLASSLGKNRVAPVLAALVASSVPWLTLLAPMGYNEGGLLLYGALAIGWALRAIDAPPRAALGRVAIAGAMAGLACGVKLTGVPMILLAVPVALAVAAPRTVRYAPVYLVAGLLLFAPWLARNFAWTGNPVFPEATGVFGRAHFSEVQAERWKRAHSPTPAQQSAGARLAEARDRIAFGWQFGFVPLTIGASAVFVSWRDRRARALALLLGMFLAFWLAFTHLQGRFFVIAVPVAALLGGIAEWRRMWTPVTASVALSAVISWSLVHQQFEQRMRGPMGWAPLLGKDDFSVFVPEDLERVPEDATVVLVGEARVFWYQRPMKLLRYRTVFDVDTSGATDVIEAWGGGKKKRAAGAWEVVHPSELKRFAETYWGVPQPGREWRGRTELVVVGPGG